MLRAAIMNTLHYQWSRFSRYTGAIFPPLYAIFQLFRLVSFIMFTIFMVDCSVYHSETSVNCTRYTITKTPGCNGYCWKGLWYLCSVLTSGIVIGVITVPNKLVEQLRPASNIRVIQCLVKKPYFWYMSVIFILVMFFDAKIETHHLTSGSSAVEVGVIVSKCLTLCIIFQLNFTYPPSRPEYSWVTIILYYITLILFLLDNLCKFVELSIWVTYKLYTINPDNHRQKAVQCLMLQVIDLSLYHSYLSFFWSKIFRGEKDVLMVYSPDLSQTVLGTQEERQTYQEL